MLLLTAAIILSLSVNAQDEMFIKKLKDNFQKQLRLSPQDKSFLKVTSPLYELDINEDGRKEYIVVEKTENQDRIFLYNSNKEKIFSASFSSKGNGSGVYKIHRRRVSGSLHVLLVHYYEGYTRHHALDGTSRLYVITAHGSDHSKLSLSRGPILFEEKHEFRRHYHKRPYKTKIEDFDGDGISEISVYYKTINRVLKYQNDGTWYLLEHGPKKVDSPPIIL